MVVHRLLKLREWSAKLYLLNQQQHQQQARQQHRQLPLQRRPQPQQPVFNFLSNVCLTLLISHVFPTRKVVMLVPL